MENPTSEIIVPTMAEMAAQGESPEILFWVGCAGSFDERAQKITRDICKILQHVGIRYAVLGTEESCTGDPAKRAGNEFLFQMQAIGNIAVLDGYNIKKIVTGCPHCFNTIKNEYPGLGGNYEVIHHSQLIQQLIDEGKLKAEGGESLKGKKDINIERMNDILESKAQVVAAACPFCMTMLSDGVKHENKEQEIQVLDIACLLYTSPSPRDR